MSCDGMGASRRGVVTLSGLEIPRLIHGIATCTVQYLLTFMAQAYGSPVEEIGLCLRTRCDYK